MKKCITLLFSTIIVFLTLFVTIVSADPAPTYSNNITDPDPPTFFLSTQTNWFNITWNNAHTVLFETNLSTLAALENITASNDSATHFYVSFTDRPPGIYQFKWFANDSGDVFNSTSDQTYIINKSLSITRLFLNGSEGDEDDIISYAINSIANVTILLKSAINKFYNPSFATVRDDNSSLPKNWFYSAYGAQSFEIGDIDTWNLTQVNLTNQALFTDAEQAILYSCSDGYPEIFSRSFELEPSTKYIFQFDIKANFTASSTDLCGGSFGFDGIEVDLVEKLNSGAQLLRQAIITNGTSINEAGSYTLSLDYWGSGDNLGNTLFANQTLTSLGSNWYRYKADYVSHSDTNVTHLEIYVPLFLSNFYEGSYVIYDNILLLEENDTLSKNVYLETNTSNASLNTSGTSTFEEITNLTEAGIFSFTGLFNETGENYSSSSETHYVFVGNLSNLTVSSEYPAYNQSDNNIKFYANITANYTNLTGYSITGATCSLTTNNTGQQFSMTYSSGLYNYSLDTEELHGAVLLSVRCTGNFSYAPQTNTTTTNVWFRSYFKENSTNFSVASGNVNTTSFIGRNFSSSSSKYVYNKTANTTNSTTGDLISFWYIGNQTSPQYAFGRDFLFKSNATVKGNVSLSNLSLAIYPCLQTTNSLGIVLQEACGSQNNTSSVDTYEVLEYNFSVENLQVDRRGYVVVVWKYNWTASPGSSPEFNISYNSSSDPIGLTIYDAEPLGILSTEYSPIQLNSSFSIGPDTIMNVSLRTIINFNNTKTARLSTDYIYTPPFSNAEIYGVQVNSSLNTTLSSTTQEFNEDQPRAPRGSFSYGDHYYQINWTTESILGEKNKNETVGWMCDCLEQIDQINTTAGDYQLLGNITWHVYLHKHLFSGHNITNVTPYTSYSSYGAYGGWRFFVNLTNSSGTYNITNSVTVDSTGGTVTFPTINLTENRINYRVHALGRGVGDGCTSNNECASNLCCRGYCALSCVITVSGGGGGIEIVTPDMNLSVPKYLSILLGKSSSFLVNVTNINTDLVLENISLNISGYLPGFITIEPFSIERLSFNETKRFNVTIQGTSFLTGNYILDHLAVAKARTKIIKSTANTSLTITSLSAGEVSQLIREAENSLNQMIENGFIVTNNLALLEESKKAFANGDYILAASLADSIINVKDKAFSVHSMLSDLKNDIDQALSQGLNVSLTERLYDLASASFDREDYVRAEELVEDARLTYAVETQGRVNILIFVANNWPYLLALIIFLWYFGGFGYRRIELYWIGKRLLSLTKEESIIDKLRAEADKDYFTLKKISRGAYYKFMHEYEKRLEDIGKSRHHLILRLSSLTNISLKIKQLEDERKILLGKIKILQKRYFKEKSMSRSDYDRELKNYMRRRITIREEISVLESRLKEKKPGKYKDAFKKFFIPSRKILIFLILFSIIPSVSFAQTTAEQASSALLTAKEDIRLMISAGFNVTSLRSMLNTSETFFGQGRYDEAYELANQVDIIKRMAFSISDRFYEIDTLALDLEFKGVNIEQQVSDYNRSKTAFYREDYSTADSLSIEVLSELEYLESQSILNRTLMVAETSNIVEYIKSNLVTIIIIIFILSAIGLFSFNRFGRVKLNKRLDYLNRLNTSVRKLTKEAQRSYFKDKNISKGEYNLRLEDYNKKLADINRELRIITSKLKK